MKKRKLLALCLSAALVLSTAGLTAFAADEPTTDPSIDWSIFPYRQLAEQNLTPSDSATVDMLDTPLFAFLPGMTEMPEEISALEGSGSLENGDLDDLLPDFGDIEVSAEWTSSDPSVLEISEFEGIPLFASAKFKKTGKTDITCALTIEGQTVATATLHVTLTDEIKNGTLAFNSEHFPVKVGGFIENGTVADLDQLGLIDGFFSLTASEEENALIPNPTAEEGLFVGYKNGKETTYLLNAEELKLTIEDESVAGFATYYLDEDGNVVKDLPKGLSKEDAVTVSVIEGKKDGTTKITAALQGKTATTEIKVGTGVKKEDPPKDDLVIAPVTPDPVEPEPPVTPPVNDDNNNPKTSDTPIALASLLAMVSAAALLLPKRRK